MKKIIQEILPVFVSRQSQVYQAMSELRPDLLVLATETSKDKLVEKHIKAQELSKEHSHVPQYGMWKTISDEWDYFIHGTGCRLINRKTNEPIEWDAPDIDIFDNQWFLNWVQWYLKHNEIQAEVPDKTLMEAFESLIKDGSIEKIKTRSGIKFRIRH